MIEVISSFEQLIKKGQEYLTKSSELEMSRKATLEKWSKKEILGHLIDSGINNLQRFTEIQFEEKPYSIRKYNQNELVKANDYQNSETKELIEFWNSVNNRILNLIKKQNEKTLSYKIEYEEGNNIDLKFLINDYIAHLAHHLKQIMT